MAVQFVMNAVCLFSVIILKYFYIPTFYICQFQVNNYTYPLPTCCRVKASRGRILYCIIFKGLFNLPFVYKSSRNTSYRYSGIS